MVEERIIILDFGSQYTQLIARRVRELNVYCEIWPYNTSKRIDFTVKGVILSGSPYSVRDNNAPFPELNGIKGKLPLLGICYGAQYLSHRFGGEVAPSKNREYGRANLEITDHSCKLLHGMSDGTQVWMSHGDTIVKIPSDYRIVGSTSDVKIVAFLVEGEETYGIQFHPEVYHTTEGIQLLRNFVVDICGCRQEWTAESFITETIRTLQETMKQDKVVLGPFGWC